LATAQPTADKINKARDELAKKTGGEVHAVQVDMTKEDDIKRMVEAAQAKLGGVDILINNAGDDVFRPFRGARR
jgi:NAD(P)-dependent dehydrogenase (short-subunit alcohol dehydrogenase family)